MPSVAELKEQLLAAEESEKAAAAEAQAGQATAAGVTGEHLKAVAPNGESFVERCRALAEKLATEGKLLESEAIGPQEAGIVNPVLFRVIGDLVDHVFKGV